MTSRPTERHLLEAATAVFAEAGFHTATMEAVAHRAGSTKPTLYAHFGSKDGLYRACTHRAAELLRSWLFRAYATAADLPLEQQVRAGMAALFNYAAAHPVHFRLLFGSEATGTVPVARHQLMAAATRELGRRIRDYTERHGPRPWAASADLCAAFVVGLSVEGARHALFVDPVNPTLAGEFATSFAVAALRHVSPDLAAAVDGARPAPTRE